jgi:hypothetical protein
MRLSARIAASEPNRAAESPTHVDTPIAGAMTIFVADGVPASSGWLRSLA